MKILVLSWRDPLHPMSGGAEQVMHEHMKGWVEAGHEVTLFSSYFVGGEHQQNMDGVEVVRKGRQIVGVHIEAFLWYTFYSRQQFDLVVDQFHGIPFFTPLYVRVQKRAVVQEIARNVWLKNQLPWPFNWIFGVVGLVTEPIYFLLYRSVPIMTGSESARIDLISMGIPRKNITIIPHGVKLTLPKKLPLKEKKPTVIFLGAIAKDKGIEDALRAFAILKEQGVKQFWVVGKAGEIYMKEVQKIVESLGLSNNVHFFGFVKEKRKFELLARAHIMVNPSAHEGWGLVNIEANSVGTPVVAYPSAGLTDSVQTGVNGVICDKKTPVSLANSVFGLLEDTARLNKLSKSSRIYSSRFHWDQSKKLSLKFIERQ